MVINLTQDWDISEFAYLVEKQQGERMARDYPNNKAPKVRVKPGRLYVKVDVADSGKYMIERSTGKIYGIKGYGRIHRGHCYGTLDTIHQWDWSGYAGVRL